MYNDVDILQRYINVIKILKSRNDYKVSGDNIGDAIDAYIDKGNPAALGFITTLNSDNDFIKKNERQ